MTSIILLVALEDGRWGPARLPEEFMRAGATVHAMAPAGNPVAASSHITRHFKLSSVKSSRHFRAMLLKAMTETRPVCVIPCDEQAVAALHHVIRRGGLPRHVAGVLQDSLGPTSHFNSLLMKDQTLDLAEGLGLAVPERCTVSSLSGAAAAAARLGFPAYVKSSFSWAGMGTISVTTPDEAAAAYSRLDGASKSGRLKNLLRRALARDWYPDRCAVQVQKALPGMPAMFCVVAWKGKYLGGFAGIAMATASATGPSTRVRLERNRAFEEAAEKLIAATGASGFLGFDFMWSAETGTATLLECNPRPIQVCHLGRKMGLDMTSLLLRAINGQASSPQAARNTVEVSLFPQAWFVEGDQIWGDLQNLDIPEHDKGLWSHALNCGKARGLSPTPLVKEPLTRSPPESPILSDRTLYAFADAASCQLR
jgi:hypothetical protein